MAAEEKDRSVEELFGQVVTRLRDELGLTQEELAFRAGLGTNTIQKYEAGEREPRAKALLQLAGALKTTTDELLKHSAWVPREPGQGGYMRHRAETDADAPDGA